MEKDYLKEAFKALEELNEDVFDISLSDEFEDAKEFIEEPVDDREEEIIIDPLAETEEELEKDYIGKAILQCEICQSMIYKNPDEVIIDEESGLANMDEVCPFCQSQDGFKVIGEIKEFCDDEECGEEHKEESEEDTEKEPEEKVEVDSEEKVEVEEEPKKEKQEESIKTRKRLRLKEQNKDLKEMSLYGLQPEHDSRNSFYNKATVDINDETGEKTLYSYNTPVVKITKEKEVELLPKWDSSATTLRHVKEFLKQNGLSAESLKQIRQDYLKESTTRDKIDADADDKKEKAKSEEEKKNDNADSDRDYKLKRKGLKESKRLNESVNEQELADFIKKAVVEIENGSYATWYNKIGYSKNGTPLYLVIGTNSAKNYDKEDLEYLATDDTGEYVIVGKIAVNIDDLQDDYDFDWYMPYDAKTGDVWDTDRSFGKSSENNYLVDAEDILSTLADLEDTYINNDATIGKPKKEIKEENLQESDKPAAISIEDAQKWVDYDMKKYGKISERTNRLVKKAGFQILKDDHGDYEVAAGKFESCEESLKEDFNKVDIETDTQKMSMESDESGKVTVTTEPKEEKPTESGEVIAPVSDEVKAEFKSTEEENAEEPAEVDYDFDEFEEKDFDSLGENYLRKVYENVKSFKTTNGAINGNTLKLEGLITFKSGKQVKTNFVFEAYKATKTGKLKFLGENKQFAKGKKSFTLSGKADGKKLVCESLTYNYVAKSTDGSSKKLYGTVKK